MTFIQTTFWLCTKDNTTTLRRARRGFGFVRFEERQAGWTCSCSLNNLSLVRLMFLKYDTKQLPNEMKCWFLTADECNGRLFQFIKAVGATILRTYLSRMTNSIQMVNKSLRVLVLCIIFINTAQEQLSFVLHGMVTAKLKEETTIIYFLNIYRF